MSSDFKMYIPKDQESEIEVQYDYISILASGRCPMHCPFCIGRNDKDKGEPHFAAFSQIRSFLRIGRKYSSELSISGSNTDPLFTDYETLVKIINFAAGLDYNISLHTHVFNSKTRELADMVDELCVSINDESDLELFNLLKFPLEKVRVSTVVTSMSLDWLNTGALFELEVDKFTVRKNVFEPEIEFPFVNGTIFTTLHGNRLIKYKGISNPNHHPTIAMWDYRDTNKHTMAMYMWGDGKMHNQMYWERKKK